MFPKDIRDIEQKRWDDPRRFHRCPRILQRLPNVLRKKPKSTGDPVFFWTVTPCSSSHSEFSIGYSVNQGKSSPCWRAALLHISSNCPYTRLCIGCVLGGLCIKSNHRIGALGVCTFQMKYMGNPFVRQEILLCWRIIIALPQPFMC